MKRLDLGAASQVAAAVEGQTLPVECTGGEAARQVTSRTIRDRFP